MANVKINQNKELNIDPEIWGKHGWFFLHSIVNAYPRNPTTADKKNMLNFFMYTQRVLPCFKCRENFAKHLNKYPLTDKILSSDKKLAKWLIDIHNEVNKLTHKKVLTYEEATKIHRTYQIHHNKTISFIVVTLLLIVTIALVYIIYWIYNH